MKFSTDRVRTSGVGDRETTELDRRGADNIKHNGSIAQVDYSKNPPVYRAQFGDPNDQDDYILSDWLPAQGGRAQGDVNTHFLEVGETVSMHSESGDMATAHLQPAGTYTNQDKQKAGTQKAGVDIKQSANQQERSFDRETGAMRLILKGQKKQDQSSGATSSGSSASDSQQIDGSYHMECAKGTLDMSNGVFTITFGSDTLVFKQGSFKVTIGSATMELTGSGLAINNGGITNDGHAVDKTHMHKQVQPGNGLSGPPQ